jgi:hypothetical protein
MKREICSARADKYQRLDYQDRIYFFLKLFSLTHLNANA